MISQIPTSTFQIPDYALWMLAGWILSTLLAGWSGYRWGLRSQIAAKKLEVKTAMLPLIEQFMVRAGGEVRANWFGLRTDSIQALRDPAIKLKSLLTGRSRKRLTKAWDRFSQITTEDFHVPQPNEENEKTNKMRQIFLERLSALRESVEKC